MKRTTIILLILLFTVAFETFSNPVDTETAKRVAQNFTGRPVELSCEVKTEPQIIRSETGYISMGCRTAHKFNFENETLIGTRVKSGGMPVIGCTIKGQRQGNRLFITNVVYLDGYNNTEAGESIWFTIPKTTTSDRITIHTEYEYLNICQECKILELPLIIAENSYTVIRNKTDYVDLFERSSSNVEMQEINFDNDVLVGYCFITGGSSSRKKTRYLVSKNPDNNDILLIGIGPGIDLYTRTKKTVWFTVPKNISIHNINFNYILE